MEDRSGILTLDKGDGAGLHAQSGAASLEPVLRLVLVCVKGTSPEVSVSCYCLPTKHAGWLFLAVVMQKGSISEIRQIPDLSTQQQFPPRTAHVISCRAF